MNQQDVILIGEIFKRPLRIFPASSASWSGALQSDGPPHMFHVTVFPLNENCNAEHLNLCIYIILFIYFQLC